MVTRRMFMAGGAGIASALSAGSALRAEEAPVALPTADEGFDIMIQHFTAAAHSEIKINDIPVSRSRRGQSLSFSRKALIFLRPGENTLTLSVDGGEKVDPENEMEAHLRLAAIPDGDFPAFTSGSSLSVISMNPGSIGPGVSSLSSRLDIAEDPRLDWAWMRTDATDLDTERAAIIAFGADLARVLRDRNEGEMRRLFEPLLADQEKTYGPSAVEEWADSMAGLIFSGNAPDESFTVEAHGEGRLFEIKDQAGRSPFIARTPDGFESEMVYMIGKISGNWRIIL